jgi:hypothetical protein
LQKFRQISRSKDFVTTSQYLIHILYQIWEYSSQRNVTKSPITFLQISFFANFCYELCDHPRSFPYKSWPFFLRGNAGLNNDNNIMMNIYIITITPCNDYDIVHCHWLNRSL